MNLQMATGTTRDFLVICRHRPDHDAGPVLQWHGWLGGAMQSWQSARLACQVWSPAVATLSVRGDAGGQRSIACVLTGAPVGSGTLDVERIQHQLLEAYLQYGLGALARLDGSFCGVLVDEACGIFVFTDRFGFRKAFIASRDGATYAASRATVLGRGLALPLDGAGVTSCTVLGHTIGRRTLFASCEAVMPATAVELRSHRERRYWDISRFLDERPRDARADAELCDRFNAACHAIIEAQGSPALNLTGGFDTRAVLSSALLTGRPLRAVTCGTAERAAIDPVVEASRVQHRYFPLAAEDRGAGAAAFALLTDGECDATLGAAIVDYWQRVAAIAPDGCLHGGLGEAWRCYHYKFLWPTTGIIAGDPLSYLVDQLIRARAHMLPVLTPEYRRQVADIVRRDAWPVWAAVEGANGRLAAVDAFYLLERHRGLTRVASVADLWNPAYAPFGHSVFLEAALGYLGPQNRSDTLHREIISRNAPALAGLQRYGGGSCRPIGSRARWSGLAAGTARHLLGRAAGTAVRRRLAAWRGVVSRRASTDLGGFDGGGVFDGDAIRGLSGGDVDQEGSGNIAAIASLVSSPGDRVVRFLQGGA